MQNTTDHILPTADLSIEDRGNAAPTAESIHQSLLLSRYTLEHVLSESTFSRIVLAKDVIDGTVCALKMFSSDREISPSILQVIREQYASYYFHHPYLIMPLRFGLAGAMPLVVMPFVPGGSLICYTRKHSPMLPLSEAEIVILVAQISLVLYQIHKRGSAHLDVCPTNIMILNSSTYALTDYGINRVFRNVLQQARGPHCIMHPDYASPQRYMRVSAEPEDDMFSFGVVLYELAMGRLPWESSGGMNLLDGGADAPALDDRFSPEFSQLVARCLHRSPEQRPSAEDLWHFCRRYQPETVDEARQRRTSQIRLSRLTTEHIDNAAIPDRGTLATTRVPVFSCV
jgi:eukaryotic-like serine/threonine-protein kinase